MSDLLWRLVTPFGFGMSRRSLICCALLKLLCACEPRHSTPAPPAGPHFVVQASSGGVQRTLGWLQVVEGEGARSMRRAVQLSTGQPAAISERQLKRLGSDRTRLSWRFAVGPQVSKGEVEVRCDQPITLDPSVESTCEVRFQGEGAPRVITLSGTQPLVSELWPWQLSSLGCPIDGTVAGSVDRQTYSWPLIRPLSAQVTSSGLTVRCLPVSEAPAGLSATWGARYQEGEEQGTLWWTHEGLGIWEGHMGALSWSITSPAAGLEPERGVGELSIERLALAPMTWPPSLPAPRRSMWPSLKWARLSIQRSDGRVVKTLESARQRAEPPPSAWTLVQRGRSLHGPVEGVQAGPPPLEALQGTPGYPTHAAEVRRLVLDVAPQRLTPRDRATALWSWIRAEVTAQPRAGVPRVLETLASRVGDCNEQSALLTTLLRAAGVPAEQVFGLVALGDEAGYHAWVRVWLDGVWVEVDPARGSPFVTAGHWAIAAGDERAQESLRSLLMSIEVKLSAWSYGAR